uniref:Uncharacterized protein n=1 Tax=Candidatus Kentrum sp. SD TaxID=2126332 RepID=A0A450Z5R4_9GAMM|nr:MAG: hypothetical protein BECKSD772F_GA0070984_11105 [Candidatus Kentron sp. SD]VFK49137.1 MAG: hypothetical protein BECKSD772E_GA0070983_11602 [Candidatus Kentron sp. SD]VFK80744.1 MAG: hypothetical protein BECKSD772D_GA0070982_11502 [Candidatus Kentron sp. SD]
MPAKRLSDHYRHPKDGLKDGHTHRAQWRARNMAIVTAIAITLALISIFP